MYTSLRFDVSVYALLNTTFELLAENVTGVPLIATPFTSVTVNARVTAPPSGPVAAVEIVDSVVATVSVGEVVTAIAEGALPAPNVMLAVFATVVDQKTIVAVTVEVRDVNEVEVSVNVYEEYPLASASFWVGVAVKLRPATDHATAQFATACA